MTTNSNTVQPSTATPVTRRIVLPAPPPSGLPHGQQAAERQLEKIMDGMTNMVKTVGDEWERSTDHLKALNANITDGGLAMTAYDEKYSGGRKKAAHKAEVDDAKKPFNSHGATGTWAKTEAPAQKATRPKTNAITNGGAAMVSDAKQPLNNHGGTATKAPTAKATAPKTDAISDAHYAKVAKDLGVSIETIKAVAMVESRGDGMLPSGKPKLLFESHVFSRLTQGAYDKSHADVSTKNWDRKGYGAPGEHQYNRQAAASKLDPSAAAQAACYGRFQILGENYKAAGYDSVESFVAAMGKGDAEHLKAFGTFIKSNPEMHQALRNHDWARFAKLYNGEAYEKNGFDTKLRDAYASQQSSGGLTSSPATDAVGVARPDVPAAATEESAIGKLGLFMGAAIGRLFNIDTATAQGLDGEAQRVQEEEEEAEEAERIEAERKEAEREEEQQDNPEA